MWVTNALTKIMRVNVIAETNKKLVCLQQLPANLYLDYWW